MILHPGLSNWRYSDSPASEFGHRLRPAQHISVDRGYLLDVDFAPELGAELTSCELLPRSLCFHRLGGARHPSIARRGTETLL